jgi:hypothetical protein
VAKSLPAAATPRKAFERYTEQLKQVLHCVTADTILVPAHLPADTDLNFAFDKNPARLKGCDLALFFRQKIMIIRDPQQPEYWKVTTLAYQYSFERWTDRQEIVSFHWEGDGSHKRPHIHIGWVSSGEGAFLGPKSHVPSGRVSIEDVVSYLIEELEAKPTGPFKTKWKTVIDTTRTLFERVKTW